MICSNVKFKDLGFLTESINSFTSSSYIGDSYTSKNDKTGHKLGLADMEEVIVIIRYSRKLTN